MRESSPDHKLNHPHPGNSVAGGGGGVASGAAGLEDVPGDGEVEAGLAVSVVEPAGNGRAENGLNHRTVNGTHHTDL